MILYFMIKIIKNNQKNAVKHIKCIPISPTHLTRHDTELCIARILEREPFSQALTCATYFNNYDGVGDFVKNVFAKKCFKFLKNTHELDNVIMLTNYSYESPEAGFEQITKIFELN